MNPIDLVFAFTNVRGYSEKDFYVIIPEADIIKCNIGRFRSSLMQFSKSEIYGLYILYGPLRLQKFLNQNLKILDNFLKNKKFN